MAVGLRGFHAFTGCDTVSNLARKGKRSAWNTWKRYPEALLYPEATSAFQKIAKPCHALNNDTINILERFMVLLYRGEGFSIDEARLHLFTTKSRALEDLPSTKAALLQYISRAVYQAGHLWGQVADSMNTTVPSPSCWGWVYKSGAWHPHWSDLPEIWKSCRELLKCSCETGCSTKRCTCTASKVSCALVCTNCRGNCNNPYKKLAL